MALSLIQLAKFVLLQLLLLRTTSAKYAMTLNGIIWDDSCNQLNSERPTETRQAGVKQAWAGGLELIDSAWTRFEQTHSIIVNTVLTEAQQKTINKDDPSSVLKSFDISIVLRQAYAQISLLTINESRTDTPSSLPLTRPKSAVRRLVVYSPI